MAVTRKFFVALSNDDGPWGAECDDVKDLFDFLSAPSGWLGKNVDFTCMLLGDFIIKIRRPTASFPDSTHLFITGVSGTNVVTVFVPTTMFAAYIAYLQSLLGPGVNPSLTAVSKKVTNAMIQKVLALLQGPVPTVALDTLIVKESASTDGCAVCHFSITAAVTDPAARLLYLAGYILKMVSDPTYLFKIFDNNKGSMTTKFRDPNGNLNAPNPLPTITFNTFTSPGNISIEYSGSEMSTFEACEMLVAKYQAGAITAEEAYIKSYA